MYFFGFFIFHVEVCLNSHSSHWHVHETVSFIFSWGVWWDAWKTWLLECKISWVFTKWVL